LANDSNYADRIDTDRVQKRRRRQSRKCCFKAHEKRRETLAVNVQRRR